MQITSIIVMFRSLKPEVEMPKARCSRHGNDHPCTCAMGNIYRFIEPVLLLILKEKGRSYGYEFLKASARCADGCGDRTCSYVQDVENAGRERYVTSNWQAKKSGPARRMYSLTRSGHSHLQEWAEVMGRLGDAMKHFRGKLQSRE